MSDDVIVLEWTFSPKDFFEDEITIQRDGYVLSIKYGEVEARIDPVIYDNEHKMRDVLHKSLEDRFLGVQVLTHKPFELSKSSMHRLYSDGRKDVTIFPESISITCTMGSVDFIVKDKDGNVVSDSRKDRINKKLEIAELAERHSADIVAAALLKSYKSSVTDPANELVHLYEIRDALSSCFSGERSACDALNLDQNDWSNLGRLANHEPLKQGRHRGRSAGELRDATDAEINEARAIARNFVEAYLNYLENRP